MASSAPTETFEVLIHEFATTNTQDFIKLIVAIVGVLSVAVGSVWFFHNTMPWLPGWLVILVGSVLGLVVFLIYKSWNPLYALTEEMPGYDIVDIFIAFVVIYICYTVIYSITKQILVLSSSEKGRIIPDNEYEYEYEHETGINTDANNNEPVAWNDDKPEHTNAKAPASIASGPGLQVWAIVLITILSVSVVVGVGLYIYKAYTITQNAKPAKKKATKANKKNKKTAVKSKPKTR
jgi:hypothetical protein